MMLTLTSMIALVFCLQYVACVGVYHANERRTMVELIGKSVSARALLKVSSWCLMIFSIFLCASLQGWERGVPVWLCLIAVSGFASLYVSAYKSQHHVTSGIVAVAVSVLLSAGLVLIGNPIENSEEVKPHVTVSLVK